MHNSFSLPSELSVYTVGELRPQWLGWLSDASSADGDQSAHDDICRVDAAAVGEVDAAGVQLLLSLSNALHQRQRALLLVSPSQALTNACAALGVSHLLANTEPSGVAQ
jgi:ABC-type transporter Mla MlaB component